MEILRFLFSFSGRVSRFDYVFRFLIPLAVVHAATEADAQRAILNLHAACTIASSPPPARPVIYETLRPGGA